MIPSLLHLHSNRMLRYDIFSCACTILRVRARTQTHAWCYIMIYRLSLAHTHTHMMLRFDIFSCTWNTDGISSLAFAQSCTRTSWYNIDQYYIFSGTEFTNEFSGTDNMTERRMGHVQIKLSVVTWCKHFPSWNGNTKGIFVYWSQNRRGARSRVAMFLDTFAACESHQRLKILSHSPIFLSPWRCGSVSQMRPILCSLTSHGPRQVFLFLQLPSCEWPTETNTRS